MIQQQNINIVIKIKNHPHDYLLEDLINQNHMIQDLIHSQIMFTQEITKNHFNQTPIIKEITITNLNNLLLEDHLEDLINQNLQIQYTIHKVIMCIQEIMINHFKLIQTIKDQANLNIEILKLKLKKLQDQMLKMFIISKLMQGDM